MSYVSRRKAKGERKLKGAKVGKKMATPVYKLSEKRKQQRFSIALPSEIELKGENSPALSLVSRDVCAGGAFYLTDSPLPIGSQVTIKMLLKLVGQDQQ